MGLFGTGGLKSAFSLAQLIGQDIVARSITLTQAAGLVAVQLVTGARLKLGGGTTDYLTSDGSTLISAGGGFSAGSVAAGTGGITCSSGGSGNPQGLSLTEATLTTIGAPALRPTAANLSVDLGGGRDSLGSFANPHIANAGSGYVPMLIARALFQPAAGSASFAALELRPTINGTSSGKAAALAIATLTNTLTGGTVRLADFGTTTQDYLTGFSSKLAIDLNGKLTIPTGGSADVGGIATLVGGTVTVNTTAVTANSIILVARRTTGGTLGHLSVGTITAATSFVINSSSATETSTVSWLLVN